MEEETLSVTVAWPAASYYMMDPSPVIKPAAAADDAQHSRHNCDVRIHRAVSRPIFTLTVYTVVVVVVVVTRSDQPKPPAVAIVRQNGLSSLAAGPQSL